MFKRKIFLGLITLAWGTVDTTTDKIVLKLLQLMVAIIAGNTNAVA
jgi:hypothetical protein